MSTRLPPVHRDDMLADHQKAFDTIASSAEATFGPPSQSPFVYKDSSGGLVGPFPFLLATPECGLGYFDYFFKVAKIPGLPADAKEVAILATGSKFQAAYELYAHSNVAEKTVGFSKQQTEQICRGQKPDGLNEDCSTAFDTAMSLVQQQGPLPQDLWDRCLKCFGKDGTLALVHFVGIYAYTCIMLNAMDCPIPKAGA